MPCGARLALPLAATLACAPSAESGVAVTFPASAVGAEAEVLRAQLERFGALHPGIRVVPQRTPDAANQRRQLYVQWLNAGADDPDVLQLDLIWTPEFAAAGWIQPLDAFAPDLGDFLPEALRANRWEGRLYALPWFVDVGMLYWRSDLVDAPPESFDALVREATRAVDEERVRFGLVWQGARYEGLVTVFLEHLTAFGGSILDERGAVVVDSPRAVRALEAMRAALGTGLVPREALSWHEEEVRFAFQNGQALFMRNWPYALPLLRDAERSRVAGRFAVAAFPAAAGGRAAAALGGAQLAINARSDRPEAAWRLIEFLTRPEQMLERASVAGQLPSRRSPYQDAALSRALRVPVAQVLDAIEHAVARPATPVYAEISSHLQVWLHRALSGQAEPEAALAAAAREMRAVLERARLGPGARPTGEAGGS
jgi:multiple sugar transport system substrate-binding protein